MVPTGLSIVGSAALGSVTLTTRETLPSGSHFLITTSAACWVKFGDNNVLAAANTAAVVAVGTLTNATSFADTETVTIGGVVYTFKTTLGTAPAVAYEVLIGANVAASHTNLAKAINNSGTVSTHYGTGTLIHPTVSAVGAATTTTVTAKTPGVAANAIATTETAATGSWGGAVLASGAAGVTGSIYLGVSGVLVVPRPAAEVTHLAAIRGTADGIVSITGLG